MNTYICRYCRQPSDPNSPTCPLCGAPVDIRSSVSESGWVQQPAIKDMARLQFGQSHLQIAGTTVPVAEFNLAPNDWIYFSHHVLLWTDPATRLTNMPMRGAWNRMMAGMPLVMVEGRGPGHLALSDNHAGEDLAGLVPIFPCGDLATAVDAALRVAAKGDVLLLSPACASFDQFQDFEDRGRQFKDLVKSAAKAR